MKKIITILLITLLAFSFADTTLESAKRVYNRMNVPISFWGGVDLTEVGYTRVSTTALMSNTAATNLVITTFGGSSAFRVVATNMRYMLNELILNVNSYAGYSTPYKLDIYVNEDIKQTISVDGGKENVRVSYPIIEEVTAPAYSAQSFLVDATALNGISNVTPTLTTNDTLMFYLPTAHADITNNKPYFVTGILNATAGLYSIADSPGGSNVVFTATNISTQKFYRVETVWAKATPLATQAAGSNTSITVDTWGLYYEY